ncbi:MAG: hypothetical protein ACXWQE_00090 [Bdellovibrionales bacterium]
MSDTKREQILKALVTKLESISGMETKVFRSRNTPFIRDEFPAYAVEFLTDTPDVESFPQPIISWAMLVSIKVFTKENIESGLSADQVADPLVQSAHGQMVSDLSLAGLSMDIQPSGVKNDIYDGDLQTGVISLNYLVQYRTTANDLT